VEVPLSPGELLEFIDGGDCAPMKRLPKTSNDCGCGDLRKERDQESEKILEAVTLPLAQKSMQG
jgi:hypothetical protein